MQGHPIQPLATKEHTSHSLSRAAARPITPALLTTFHGEMGKRSPLLLASLNQSCFLLFLLLCCLLYKSPAKSPTPSLAEENAPCEASLEEEGGSQS